MALLYPPTSQSFSKARWRYPISTSAPTITSPSSSATIRMIPCIAGWAGPTPRCRFCGPPPVPLPSPSMNSWRVVSAIVLARRADHRLAPGDRVVLPDRGAHQLLVHAVPTRGGDAAAISTRSGPVRLGGGLCLPRPGPGEHRAGDGGGGRDVDVGGNDRVEPLHRRVVVVEAAGARAHAEGDDPLGLGH